MTSVSTSIAPPTTAEPATVSVMAPTIVLGDDAVPSAESKRSVSHLVVNFTIMRTLINPAHLATVDDCEKGGKWDLGTSRYL